jgi:hypothetical protein
MRRFIFIPHLTQKLELGNRHRVVMEIVRTRVQTDRYKRFLERLTPYTGRGDLITSMERIFGKFTEKC